MVDAEDRRTLPPIRDSGDRYSGSSPPHAGLSRPAEKRETFRFFCQSTIPVGTARILADQSPAPALGAFHLCTSKSHAKCIAAGTKKPCGAPPRTRDLRRTAAGHCDHTSPSDPRHPIGISAEPFHRQTPPEYDTPVAGPSNLNPRRHESVSDSPPLNPHPGATEQEMRESFAWNEMQRAQYAESAFQARTPVEKTGSSQSSRKKRRM
ncbi:hypothetical protein B0H14DRAFT_169096 [Mycena olivaceomarginata]|nr:hypothetical protein B0H14DRAFT_169096 [Mycena olivaceomarginata]